MVWWRLAVVFSLLLQHGYLQTSQTTICPRGYQLRAPANAYCYQYYEALEDYSAANRSCVRDGGTLLYIENIDEDHYIYSTFFLPRGSNEFWIGLNDIDTEGVFRWENSSLQQTQLTYVNWTTGSPNNALNLDCVKYTASGWQVHQSECATSSLRHVCKMRSCLSDDGSVCKSSLPTPESTGTDPIIIVIPVVLVIVLLLLIGVIVVLLCVWKCSRETVRQYLCCCLGKPSKNVVHSMQQENQRLRHELSQHKVSMSGRFQPGQLSAAEERELSGVPDGKGGVLPTIRQPVTPYMPGGVATSQPGDLATNQRRFTIATMQSQPAGVPPPLVVQQPSGLTKQLSQSSVLSLQPVRPVRQNLQPIGVQPQLSLPFSPTRKYGEAMTTHSKLEEVSESEESTDSEHDKVSATKKYP